MAILKVKDGSQWVNIPSITGADGTSPTVSVADITGGHRVTVTDANGTRSFDVMDGEDYVLTAADKSDIAALVDAPVQDVQVNGVSVLTDGVANVPVAVGSFGVAKYQHTYGLDINPTQGQVTYGTVRIYKATDANVKAGTDVFRPIVPAIQHNSTFYGLAKAAGDTTQSASSNAVGAYTETAKSKISEMLSAPVTVSGTTPTITAMPGIQYVCGECATLDITLPESGCVDVVFESGSTPPVLTITPPTGQTVRWANGFDPTALDANTTYEINIMDGLGVAVGWT